MPSAGEIVIIKDNLESVHNSGYGLPPYAHMLIGRWGVIVNVYLGSFYIEFDGGSMSIWLPRYAFSTISEIRKEKLKEINLL